MTNEEAIAYFKRHIDLYCVDGICREAEDTAIKALGQTTWIPVSERLPEDKQEILFSTKTDRVQHGRYYLDKTCQNWYSFKDELFAYDNVVTAWMPLPEPYEPQESEEQTE